MCWRSAVATSLYCMGVAFAPMAFMIATCTGLSRVRIFSPLRSSGLCIGRL